MLPPRHQKERQKIREEARKVGRTRCLWCTDRPWAVRVLLRIQQRPGCAPSEPRQREGWMVRISRKVKWAKDHLGLSVIASLAVFVKHQYLYSPPPPLRNIDLIRSLILTPTYNLWLYDPFMSFRCSWDEGLCIGTAVCGSSFPSAHAFPTHHMSLCIWWSSCLECYFPLFRHSVALSSRLLLSKILPGLLV